MAAVLADLGRRERAEALLREAKAYREAILDAVARSERLDTKPPFIPVALFGAESPHETLTATRMGSYYDLMAPYILGSGVFGRGSPREGWMIDYLRTHGGIAMGMIRSTPHQGQFDNMPGVNPLYGLRYQLTLLRRDDAGHALVGFYGHLAQGLTRDTFIGGEGSQFLNGDARGRSFYLPPNSASNATVLTTLRYLLIQDWDLDDDGRPGDPPPALRRPGPLAPRRRDPRRGDGRRRRSARSRSGPSRGSGDGDGYADDRRPAAAARLLARPPPAAAGLEGDRGRGRRGRTADRRRGRDRPLGQDRPVRPPRPRRPRQGSRLNGDPNVESMSRSSDHATCPAQAPDGRATGGRGGGAPSASPVGLRHAVYHLARAAIDAGRGLARAGGGRTCPRRRSRMTRSTRGRSPWRLLPPFDHPEEPARCLVTGTGLTHKASAENRQSMHVLPGRRPGRPCDGAVDRQHEDVPDRPGRRPAGAGRDRGGAGVVLQGLRARSCGRTASRWTCPTIADDGGEEAEIAGAYLIGPDGTPYRVGLVQGNEFSDHVMESKNYLYLAPSKLRTVRARPGTGGRGGFRRRAGPSPDRAGRRRGLGGDARQRRAGDVALAGEPGTPSFQVRAAPPARRRPHPLLRGRPLQLPRPGPARRRRRDGRGVRRLRPAVAEPVRIDRSRPGGRGRESPLTRPGSSPMSSAVRLNAIDLTVFAVYMVAVRRPGVPRLPPRPDSVEGLLPRRQDAPLVRRRHLDGRRRRLGRALHRQRRRRLPLRDRPRHRLVEHLDHLLAVPLDLPALLRPHRPVHRPPVPRTPLQRRLPLRSSPAR